MAITFRGFDSVAYQLNEAYWARLHDIAGALANQHGIASGFAATPGAGTRELSVTAGEGMAPGVMFESSATETRTVGANGTATNRRDYLVLRVDWTANTVTLVVVPGSATLPTLVQTAGTQWDVPLARITVRPSVSTLLTTDIEVCKPLPRVARRDSGSAIGTPSIAWNASLTTISTVALSDPGWPYYVHVEASVRFENTAGGFGFLRVMNGATELMAGISPILTTRAPCTVSGITAAMSGPLSLALKMEPASMSSGTLAVTNNTSVNYFTVLQVPA